MAIDSFLIRLISLIFAVGTIAFLSPSLALLAVIFFGQAHFILAYWYKFGSIKQPWKSDFFKMWLGVSIFLLLLGIFEVFSPTFWIILAGSLFVIHNSIDDILMIFGYIDWFNVLVVFNGLLLLFLLELTSLAINFSFDESTLQLTALGTLVISLLGLVVQRSLGWLYKIYSFSIALIAAALILGANAIPTILILGCIILFHYALWYLEYAQKLWHHSTHFNTYIKRVLGLNAVLIGIGVLAWLGLQVPGYKYFFSETFFFIWTTLHIIFSFIPRDLKLF